MSSSATDLRSCRRLNLSRSLEDGLHQHGDEAEDGGQEQLDLQVGGFHRSSLLISKMSQNSVYHKIKRAYVSFFLLNILTCKIGNSNFRCCTSDLATEKRAP